MTAGPWVLIDDFDGHSINLGKCPVTGTIRKPEDPGVFRGPYVDGRGTIDLSWEAVRELIMCAGALPPDDATRLQDELKELRKQNDELIELNNWMKGILTQIELAQKVPETKPVKRRG